MVTQQVDKVDRPQNSIKLLHIDQQGEDQASQQVFAFNYEAQRPQKDAWHQNLALQLFHCAGWLITCRVRL